MTILHRIRIRGFMKKNVFRMPTPVKITGRTQVLQMRLLTELFLLLNQLKMKLMMLLLLLE